MKTKVFLLLLCSIACTVAAFGQTFTDDVNDVPFDGGISLLVAAGVGYGLKQRKKLVRKKVG